MKRLLSLAGMFVVVGCAPTGSVGTGGPETTVDSQSLTWQQLHGLQVWFNSTFGGEVFFSRILPSAPFNLPIGLDLVLTTPRDQRFDQWGVINDPGCTDGDASTGFLDRCFDPHSSGVVGVRKFVQADGSVLVGVACAGCHAGFNPSRPPADPNHPSWFNIHPTIGNQFIQIGKIFGAKLNPHDPRKQVFDSWAPGTVDTTVLENDHINNPGIITQFFNVTQRPFFDLNYFGNPIHVHRGGQGGEDDAGCEKAALRVYFNIGMCAAECMIPHLANGPGGTQTEIDIQPGGECEQRCAAFVQAESDVVDLCSFIVQVRPPQLSDAPNGDSFVDSAAADRGQVVFNNTCASCHGGSVYSDDLLHPAEDIGTNSCRSRTTNWQAGHIWGQFSSDEQRARGTGFYRDVPLLAVWATAPLLHNNRLGVYNGDPSVGGRIAAFEASMLQMLNPSSRVPDVAATTDFVCLDAACSHTLPAGVPVGAFANVDPATGANLCPDFVENEGHTFGAELSDGDKSDLIEFLKTL